MRTSKLFKDSYGIPIWVGDMVAFNRSGQVKIGKVTKLHIPRYNLGRTYVMIQDRLDKRYSKVMNTSGIAVITGGSIE